MGNLLDDLVPRDGVAWIVGFAPGRGNPLLPGVGRNFADGGLGDADPLRVPGMSPCRLQSGQRQRARSMSFSRLIPRRIACPCQSSSSASRCSRKEKLKNSGLSASRSASLPSASLTVVSLQETLFRFLSLCNQPLGYPAQSAAEDDVPEAEVAVYGGTRTAQVGHHPHQPGQEGQALLSCAGAGTGVSAGGRRGGTRAGGKDRFLRRLWNLLDVATV
jgi:hypothetical protein